MFRDLSCQIDAGGNSGICCWAGEPPVCYNCVLQENGKWDCVKIVTSPPPPALRDAIVKAQSHASAGAGIGNNNTNVLEGNVLKHGGAIKGGETDNNTPTNSNYTLR